MHASILDTKENTMRGEAVCKVVSGVWLVGRKKHCMLQIPQTGFVLCTAFPLIASPLASLSQAFGSIGGCWEAFEDNLTSNTVETTLWNTTYELILIHPVKSDTGARKCKK